MKIRIYLASVFLLAWIGCAALAHPARGQAPTDSAPLVLRFVVNGNAQGSITAIKHNGHLMVPLRSLLESLDWTVHYESVVRFPDNTISGTKEIRASPPFLDRDNHVERVGQKGYYKVLFNVGKPQALAYSPSWSMGDEYGVRPAPILVRGRAYVPLAALEEVLANRFGDFGRRKRHPLGDPAVNERGIKFTLAEDERKLRMTYLPIRYE